MRIRQYVYFSVFSETTSADQIGDYLGLASDDVIVRGSHSADSPSPNGHSWRLLCDSAGLRIDEQVSIVLDRLRHIEERLVRVGPELLGENGGCILQLVRYFDADDGEAEESSPRDASLLKLAGQHQLLGWHLDSDSLSFLARVGAEIDADEYG